MRRRRHLGAFGFLVLAPSGLLAQSALVNNYEQAVVWTDHSNTLSTPGHLWKSGGSSWGWDGGAVSSQALTGDGYVEITAAASYVMFGLSHGNSSQDWTDIDFAMQTHDGLLYIYEGGYYRGSFGTFVAGDKLRVAVEGSVVTFRKNGSLLYTAEGAPLFPLLIDTTFLAPGPGIQGAVIYGGMLPTPVGVQHAVDWIQLANASVVAGNLQKTGGSSWGWDGGGVSSQTISGDGYVEVTAAASYMMFGLSHGNSSQDWSDIDFAMQTHDGSLYIYEGGYYRGVFGPFTPGDKLRVGVEGGVVTWRRNGMVLYVSVATPTYPLLVDSSLLQTGATIQGAVVSSQTAAPVFSPSGGAFTQPQTVTISTETVGATIRYTLNGAEPTESDLVVGSGGTILIGVYTTLKAKAWAPGMIPSGTTTAQYAFTPGSIGNYAQSMTPVSGSAGPHLAAPPFPLGPDDTAGRCESELVTSYVQVPAANTKKAIFYFPWHSGSGECGGDPNSTWCQCVWRGKPNDPRPLTSAGPGLGAGLYDSASPEVINQHMATIAARGIDIVAIEWGGTDNGGTRREDGIALRPQTGVVAQAAAHGLQVALLYDLAVRDRNNLAAIDASRVGYRDQMSDDFGYFLEQYFSKPNYFRINGRPVVYIYISREIKGGVADVVELFRRVREVTDFYFVADVLFWGGVDFNLVRAMRPDAVTAFHAFEKTPAEAAPPNSFGKMGGLADAAGEDVYDDVREDFLVATGSPAIHPGVSPQYDDASTAIAACGVPVRNPQQYHLTGLNEWDYVLRRLATGERWAASSVRVRRNCSQQVLSSPTDPAVVWLYSFNEWAEGSGVEPLQPRPNKYPFGFGTELIDRYGQWDFTQGVSAVGVPFARSPVGLLEGERPNFAWDGIQGGVEYRLRVKNNGGATLLERTGPETVLVGHDGLPSGESLTWQIQGKNGAGVWSEWSPSVAFQTSSTNLLSCGSLAGQCLLAGQICGEDHSFAEASDCSACCVPNNGGPGGSCQVLGPTPQSFTLIPGTMTGVAAVGTAVTFTANSSATTPGLPVLWDVGNGVHLQGATASYSYAAPGNYNVTMTSNDARCGSTQLTTIPLHVGYLPCTEQAQQAGFGEGSCRADNPDPSSACFAGETPLDSGESGGCWLGTRCCAFGAANPCASNETHNHTGSCGVPDSCGHPIGSPQDPGCQSCGAQGGEICSATGSCPAGYSALGTSYQNGAIECQTCCNLTNGDGHCEVGVEDCGTSPDCPCWMAGTTCNASGSPGQCVDRCSEPAYHNHTGSCGQADECGHAIGTATECLPSCGALGGDYCSQTPNWCPADHGYLNQSNDCASCCQLDPCASPETHDHGGSCGSVDSCGHVFGSNEECGCPGAPTVFDTCWHEVCDTGWSWVPQICENCTQQCTTEWSCSTVCDEGGCWNECVPYDSCSQVCSSYECGGYWTPIPTNCRQESYQCNPHQCVP